MKHLRTLTLVLVVIMLGAFLAGCDMMKPQQAPVPAPAPATPQAAAPAPAPAPAPQAGQTPPPAQLGTGSTAPTAQASIPTEAKLNLQQGMNYMRLRDWDNAIKEFTVAIEKFPQYDTAYSNRAVAYMQQRKFNKADDDLKKGVEINPKNSTLHYNYVALYSLQSKLDRALDSLDKTLELGFNNYDSLRKDPDLNNVRQHPEFRKICEKYKVFL
jgi:tetratricopeptide (TPR) repeat protein